MKLRKLALAPIAAAIVGFAPAAQADWVWNFQDLGVDYTLTFDQLSATTGTFQLTLDTSGYNHHADPSYLNAVDIKAWGGHPDSISLTSATGGLANWTSSGGSTSANGCGASNAGFACAETVNPGANNVDDGPYTFEWFVTSNSFNQTFAGSHVGAVYTDVLGNNGGGYGNTSVVGAIPEPETYAMMLAGLGLLGFVARRRRQSLGNVVPA